METLNSRQRKEVELINTFHYMTFKQLVQEFSVSEMTIRRDISLLVSKKYVQQIYGGALSLEYSKAEKNYTISQEISKNTLLKKNIAKRAMEFLEPNDVVFLDSGTTVQLFAEEIPEDASYTFVTASWNTQEVLVRLPNCTLISPGGVFAPKPKMFYNPEASAFFKKHRANKCFIGTTGFDLDLGLTCHYYEDVSNKQAMIESSREKILLLDSTKYDRVSTFVFAKIEMFSTVITDRAIPEAYAKKIQDLDVKLILV